MTHDDPARYVMIGGFLGAGKTTAVDRLARVLTARGRRVGLITNDQSSGLVDTAILRSRGFAVEEIAGGCFCCRFDSLQEAADRLDAATRPEVFLAEPVGSCTDLVATVSYPLRRIYGERFTIAPLSVLVDPHRAARVLGLAAGRTFSPKVVYVYEKQLEEADLLVVNKCDAIDGAQRDRLVTALRERFPASEVLCVSAKDGTGLDAWFARILERESPARATMQLDYDTYAEGEAQLGWCNATLHVTADQPFDGNELLVRWTDSLRAQVRAAGGEIAHLKMTLDARQFLDPAASVPHLSVVSVVGCDDAPDLRESLLERIPGGALIVNLRAELDPAILSRILTDTVRAENAAPPGSGRGVRLTIEHQEHFRPARPVPTHRDVVARSAARSAARS